MDTEKTSSREMEGVNEVQSGYKYKTSLREMGGLYGFRQKDDHKTSSRKTGFYTSPRGKECRLQDQAEKTRVSQRDRFSSKEEDGSILGVEKTEIPQANKDHHQISSWEEEGSSQ